MSGNRTLPTQHGSLIPFHISFVPPWRFWPRSWFGYARPKRVTLPHNPAVYRWLWWNFSFGPRVKS